MTKNEKLGLAVPPLASCNGDWCPPLASRSSLQSWSIKIQQTREQGNSVEEVIFKQQKAWTQWGLGGLNRNCRWWEMLSWIHLRGVAKGVRIAVRRRKPEGLVRDSYPTSAPAWGSLCYPAGVWQTPWTGSCEWSISRPGKQWSAPAAVPASTEKGLWQISLWEPVDACYFVYDLLSFSSLFPKQCCSAKPFMICEQGSRTLWTLS